LRIAAHRLRTWLALTILGLVFIAQGWPFVRGLGIEVDEALIGYGIYLRIPAYYSWHWGGYEIPVMLLTYMGTLKAWIYNGIFAMLPPSATVLRAPMMIAGVLTIWIFFWFLKRIAGRTAAWIGALLLATDTSFLLTDTIDFGGVALQHVFKLGAILLLLRFHQSGSRNYLAGGFLLLGLGLWDKAVFLWVLGGLGIAAIAIFPRELLPHLKIHNIAAASIAFIMGALPFVVYNVAHPLETFRANVNVSADNDRIKVHLLRQSLNGEVNFTFLTAPDPGPAPGRPHRLTQRVAFAVSDFFGHPTNNWIIPAWVLSLLTVPFVWDIIPRRAVLFSIILPLVTWIQMLLTTGAGAAVHHIILLWPFHLALIAIVLSRLAMKAKNFAKPILVAAALLLCGRNVLLNNQYYVELVRNGGSVRWTDAFTPLIQSLKQRGAHEVFLVDWGITETVNLLTEGGVPVHDLSFGIRDSAADPRYRQWEASLMESKNNLWVGHSAGAEQWPGINAKLSEIAAASGYRKELLETVLDRNGRAIFELFRFRK
jgi:hypothetical protein